MSKSEYRYRSGNRDTLSAQKRLHHLSKIGKLQYIRAFAFWSKHKHDGSPTIRIAVIVRGDKGYARYEGLSWGFNGTGPQGLRKLFDFFRIPESIAAKIAHETESPDYTVTREFWKLTCGDDNESFDLTVKDKQNKVIEHKRYGIQETSVKHQGSLFKTDSYKMTSGDGKPSPYAAASEGQFSIG